MPKRHRHRTMKGGFWNTTSTSLLKDSTELQEKEARKSL